jgi:hypothetical protein
MGGLGRTQDRVSWYQCAATQAATMFVISVDVNAISL